MINNEIKNPLVTVVITSYNHEKYIEEAIESIVNQEYENIEIIVIDDGSTDSSPYLIEKLAEKHNFKYVRKKNEGLVSTVNLGYAMATGEFLISHGSDDRSLPNRIKNQVKQLLKYPEVGYVTSNLNYVNSDGKYIKKLTNKKNENILFDFNDFMYGRARSTIVTCMFRTEAVKKILPLKKELLSEDYQLFMYITEIGYKCLVWEDQPVIDYRVHAAGLSKTNLENLMRAQLKMLEKYNKHPGYETAKKIGNTLLFAAMVENKKIQAIKFIAKERIDVFSKTGLKSIIKLLIPNMIIIKIKTIKNNN